LPLEKSFLFEPIPGHDTGSAWVLDPDSVRRYLGKFGADLKAVRSAVQKLAKVYRPQELAHGTYRLYERFRPDLPEGKRGWGAKGDLDLVLVGRLAKERADGRRAGHKPCAVPSPGRASQNSMRSELEVSKPRPCSRLRAALWLGTSGWRAQRVPPWPGSTAQPSFHKATTKASDPRRG
jgi:hypothetical protein